MDKRSLLGLISITIIVTIWLFYTSVQQQPEIVTEKKQDDTLLEGEFDRDSADESISKPAEIIEKSEEPDSDRLKRQKFGSLAHLADGKRELITIETDLIKAQITNKGAAIVRWYLKEYKKWDGDTVQLIWEPKGEYFIRFLTFEDKRIDSRDLFFTFNLDTKNYRLSGKDSLQLVAKLELSPGRTIEKIITFYGDKYHISSDIVLNNVDDFIPSRGYSLIWSEGLHYQEYNSVDETVEAVAMVSLNGEFDEISAEDNKTVESSSTGMIDFTSVKIKYFTATIVPQPFRSFDGTIDLTGRKYHIHKGDERRNSVVSRYSMSYRVPYKGGKQTNSFVLYVGPLDYDILKEYNVGLEGVINFGWRLVVRPIGEFFMLPIFKFIHSFIPNYGISLIVFSILMKLLLYPLSIQQMRSAQRMQLLAPEISNLREKYKEDNTKQQQEIMKLYSEYGINPMGGCLPLLLQLPILYALWSVLRVSIDLRQAEFMLWINDLSVPDYIFDLGFKLPLIGIDKFSGLALLMGATLFIQQKMTMTDPRQKGLVYIMPIMFTLLFSNFPSGLNLYYFIFNLIGILQQVYMNKFSSKKLTLADLKRMPKKEGWLQKKMREAQEIAAAQGKSIPGQPKSDSSQTQRTQSRPRKNYRRKR